jgi:hypothetical protein
MKSLGFWLRALSATLWLGTAWGATAEGVPISCDQEAHWRPAATTRHFLVLAAANGVFYNGSGPSFVMLMKTDTATDEVEMGAVGIYAGENGRVLFGTVPWQTYDAFLREPGKESPNVMLRLEINGPQYERVRRVLLGWKRRAEEHELLYR